VPAGERRTEVSGWSYRGELFFAITRQTADFYGDRVVQTWSGKDAETLRGWISPLFTGAAGRVHGFYGFIYGGQSTAEGYFRFVHIPTWAVVCALAVLPTFAMMRYRRQVLWARRKCCTNCFYNLTCNTSGVCPECGNAIVGKAET
jgi:hypothetical protein